MKSAIVLLAFVALSHASPLSNANYAVNTGSSQVTRSDDGNGNFEWGYTESSPYGGTSRQEKGGKGWQVGSYSLQDKDGRKRTVRYVADANGFRATIDTNEPGVDDKQDPADVQINSGSKLSLAPIAAPVLLKSSPILINSYDSSNDGSLLSSANTYSNDVSLQSLGNSYSNDGSSLSLGNSYSNLGSLVSSGDSYSNASPLSLGGSYSSSW